MVMSYYSALIFKVFRAKSPRIITHAIRQHDCNQWDGPIYVQLGKLPVRMQSFSTWPASSNQNVNDLSKDGFLYTGNVF